MKWFKHISDSLDDPFIFELIRNFGGDGYLVFFGVLEIIAREYHHNSDGTVVVSDKFLSKKLQLSRRKTLNILTFCQNNSRIFYRNCDGMITLNCPKMKELKDNYTKDKLASNLQETGKKLSNHNRVQSKEIDIKNPPTPRSKKPVGKDAAKKKDAVEILTYLNRVMGKRFDVNLPQHHKYIMARLSTPGITVAECKKVIDTKSKDPHFLENPKYMNPKTLFCPANFDRYLNENPDDYDRFVVKKKPPIDHYGDGRPYRIDVETDENGE